MNYNENLDTYNPPYISDGINSDGIDNKENEHNVSTTTPSFPSISDTLTTTTITTAATTGTSDYSISTTASFPFILNTLTLCLQVWKQHLSQAIMLLTSNITNYS